MPFICTWRKNLGGFFLVDSFKREIKYKSLHISGYSVLWYCCSVIYMSLLKPGVLSLLSHLGREQSQFHLLAQRREISIIFVGVGNRALSLITSVVEHGWRKEALTLLFSGHHNWPPSWGGHWPGSSLRHTKYPWDSHFSTVRVSPTAQGLFWQPQFSCYGWQITKEVENQPWGEDGRHCVESRGSFHETTKVTPGDFIQGRKLAGVSTYSLWSGRSLCLCQTLSSLFICS